MKIGALAKVVPDTYAHPRIGDDQQTVTWDSSIEWVRDRYSQFAVEEAVKIKEKHGGEAISFTITNVDEKKPIRKSLAIGIDKAIVIENEEVYDSDPYSVAKALAEEIKEHDLDIILGGKLSSDKNFQLVPQLVAAFLDIPIIAEVRKLEITDNGVVATRKLGNRQETIEAEFPVVITTEKGLNEPRYPKLPNIMKAKRKPTEWKDSAKTEVTGNVSQEKLEYPEQKDTEVVMINGDSVDAKVEALLKYLIEEDKVL